MGSMVAQRLIQITPPAATPDQLWQHVEAAWSAVPQEHIQSLFESMPRRVAAGQAFVAYPHRPMTLHSLTENSLAVLNHKILEANSQVQDVKLGGHPTCLSINRLWHELCDMLRRLVGTTAPGHHDCSIQE
ncbi:uncharacterized protein TNCV_4402221 [Trichonephila clavipes]|nr:uncharacterized protein TNCV_4402221 [Trichonephila clavipes]